ncbi:MAG TPA: hypothetical protein VJU61_05800 [Polyangiaceae bacterium]|nr:hypothetical protein [Polyangiaceae bacterium]
MFGTGWGTWIRHVVLVAAAAQLGCGVDARSVVVGGSGTGGAGAAGTGDAAANPAGAAGASLGEAADAATELGPCDPVRPQTPRARLDACRAEDACSAGPQGSACRTANATAGEGATCAGDRDCGSGLFCGESGVCRQYCFDSADCTAGVCGLFREPRFAGGVEVGFCSTGACDPSSPQRPRESLGACPAGENCRAAADGASYCEPAGTDAFHEACEGDSCAPGLFCGTGSFAGACNRYCIEDSDCTSGDVCAYFATAVFTGSLQVGFCASRCDPVNPRAPAPPLASCEAGFGCVPRTTGDSYCIRAGLGTLYSSCDATMTCSAGFTCASVSDVCTPYCFGSDDCAVGVCEQFSSPLLAGARSVGFCAEVCDPVDPQLPRAPLAACPDGFRCQARTSENGGRSYCGRAGQLAAGAACTENSECGSGYFCSTGSGCVQYCYTDADCDSGNCADDVAATAFAGTFSVFRCAL